MYGPPLGKKFIVFCDDINMPELDEVESQPAVELLRQLLDHQVRIYHAIHIILAILKMSKLCDIIIINLDKFQTWYDNKELFPMKLIDMQVIGAMRPPDGSRYFN